MSPPNKIVSTFQRKSSPGISSAVVKFLTLVGSQCWAVCYSVWPVPILWICYHGRLVSTLAVAKRCERCLWDSEVMASHSSWGNSLIIGTKRCCQWTVSVSPPYRMMSPWKVWYLHHSYLKEIFVEPKLRLFLENIHPLVQNDAAREEREFEI